MAAGQARAALVGVDPHQIRPKRQRGTRPRYGMRPAPAGA
jgi:hypothetical protein